MTRRNFKYIYMTKSKIYVLQYPIMAIFKIKNAIFQEIIKVNCFVYFCKKIRCFKILDYSDFFSAVCFQPR